MNTQIHIHDDSPNFSEFYFIFLNFFSFEFYTKDGINNKQLLYR